MIKIRIEKELILVTAGVYLSVQKIPKTPCYSGDAEIVERDDDTAVITYDTDKEIVLPITPPLRMVIAYAQSQNRMI